jgi:UDP-galactopyranose mutase
MGTKQNILIVGAGFAGSVIARELAENDYVVTVIDSRNHVAGNAYDYVNEYGLTVHKYGPHLFHTNNKKVFDWLSKFTEWTPYVHTVNALVNSKYVPFPVNTITLKTIKKEDIQRIFFEPYSKKMWGEYYSELSKDVFDRVKVRDTADSRYFTDDYQYMPTHGYTVMFNNILDHKNITVKLNTSFEKTMENDYEHVFNSMAIDSYYDYSHGELPYRSIKFHNKSFIADSWLPVTTVNFTDNSKHTRVTEWNKLPNNKSEYVSLTFEEPCDYKDNSLERYYPIMTDKYRQLYSLYKNIPNDKVTFIGRCGLYVYIDMHQAVSSSLETVKKFLDK